MSDTLSRKREYGTWSSPISAEMVAGASIDFWHVETDGDAVYWREGRPDEGGQGVVVRYRDGETVDVTPEGISVASLVYESGGGEFTVHDGVVYYVDVDDQRVYRKPLDAEAEAITPEPETPHGLRYADFDATEDGRHLYCVREDHDAVEAGTVDEPVSTLVRLAADRASPPTVVASGHDFYAAPRLSPDGDRLAYLAWDHPRMPWDGTELHLADVTPDGTLANDCVVMGGPDESVLVPAWRPDGTLHAVSDRTGWWNLYRREGETWRAYREDDAEHAVPPWLAGLSTYAFLDDGRVAVVAIRDGRQSLELLDEDGTCEVADLPYAAFGGEYCLPVLRSDGESLYVVGGGPATLDRFVKWSPGAEPDVLRHGGTLDVDEGFISKPEHVSVPTRDGAETHAFVYEPTNPDVEPPDDELPSLVVRAPGGPTLGTHPAFNPSIQYFTSRGFAVADVNYRGSTGYGRAYREALYGEWGIADVQDCLDVAAQLAEQGRVDDDRIAIRGFSAGGYIALSALTFHDEVAAGVSQCGIADLEEWAAHTHKFESRYADRLVGPYPDTADAYRARSPIHHADGIDAPALLLQGEEDAIVPPSQAAEMVEALDSNDVPHELLVFEGEGHLFHHAETIRRVHEAELAFYGEVFGLDTSEEVPAIGL